MSPETRAELGAYLPLNYEKHILHWLKHGLTFTFDEISDKQGLMSAIRQYAGFLEKRLGLNAETDPYVSLVDQVKLALGEANPYLLLGHATQMILARRTYVCGAQSSSEADKRFFEAYGSSEAEGGKGEKQQMLKCLFYGRLDETVADDDDNRFVEKYTNFALSMTATLPAQTGLAYVDFFWESGDSDDYCRKRDVFLDALVSVGYEKGCIIDDLIYHNVNYVRCVVNRPSDIFKFHDALKSTCSVELHPIHDSASSVHMSADILSLLRLQVVLKKLIARMDDVDRERFGALADDRSTHYFYGHNKWAWQRSTWNNYGMAAVEVFPHRDADEKAFWRYLTESNGGYPYWIYRWNGGRIVYQFPIAADDGYERRLTKFLSDWQLDEMPCLQCVDSWSSGTESA